MDPMNEPTPESAPDSTPESIPQPNESRGGSPAVVLVVFGFVYIVVALLWMWATTSNQIIFESRFDESMSAFGEFFAIAAAPLWYFTTLNQIRSFSRRVVVLVLGLVLLAPLPLVVGVSPL